MRKCFGDYATMNFNIDGEDQITAWCIFCIEKNQCMNETEHRCIELKIKFKSEFQKEKAGVIFHDNS
jgi:hypothetical protein